MPSGRAIVIRGNSRQLPLPDESVDLIVTSPPYYSLRSYTDQGRHYDGQIGAEPTPRQYIESLMECTREWVRVLKPSGSIFVNLGDTYSSVQGVRENHDQNLSGRRKSRGEGKGFAKSGPAAWGVPSKSLIGIPWRYALACVDEGLIVRRDIIWNKPNGIPESVDDRVRTSHEYIFHIVKARRYFTGIDEIREPHQAESFARFAPGRALPGRRPGHIYNGHPGQTLSLEKGLHPAGRLPGSVWTMPVQPLIGPQCRLVWDGRTICWFNTWAEGERHMRMLARDAWMWAGSTGRPSLRAESEHYAAFPMELPRRIIQGWAPRAACDDCGFLLGSSYDSGMLGVRQEFRSSRKGRKDRPALLQQEVQHPVHGTQPCDDERVDAEYERVHPDTRTGSSDGGPEWLHHGAPSGDGRTSGPDAPTRRGSASQERSEGRQPPGEPGTPGKSRTRQDAETKTQTLPVSALRRSDPDVRDSQSCPNCGSDNLRPPIILDPFGGTGCAAMVAATLGRVGVSVDYSHSYSRFARWRTTSKTERAKAMQIKKPPPPPDPRQGALFDMEEM